MSDILVHAGYALLDADRAASQRDVGILVREGRIEEIGPWRDLAVRHSDVPQAGGPDAIAAPGFVNSHQHGMGLSVARLGDPDDSLESWVLRRYAPYAPDVYLDTLYTAVRMLAAGVTTAVHAHYYRGPDGYRDRVDAALRAYRDAGLRVVFCPGISDQNQLVYADTKSLADSMDPAAHQFLTDLESKGLSIRSEDYFPLVDELVRAYEHDGGRIRIGYYPITPQAASDDLLQQIREAADRTGRIIHTHIVETPYQVEFARRTFGTTQAQHLRDIGFLGPMLSLAHGVWLDHNDVDALAEAGATVVHCPSSNLRVRSGIAPSVRYRAAGLRLGLGTDNLSLADDEDYLVEMRMATVLAGRPGLEEPRLAVDDVWRMATVSGAFALGLGDRVGSLQVGNQADIVLYNDRELHRIPDELSPHHALVRFGSRLNVDTVIVGGDVLVRDGRHTTVDETELLQSLIASITPPSQESLDRIRFIRAGIRKFYREWATDKVGRWNVLDR